MKNNSTTTLTLFFCFLFFANVMSGQCPDPEAVICDDFESYTLDNISSQADHWTPWGGVAGATDDGIVSDAMATSGTQSLLISEANGDDMLLLLGDQNNGQFELSFKLYVPSGNTGYFNTQKFEDDPGGEFGMQVEFFADGTATLDAGAADVVTHDWTADTWMEIVLFVDLANDSINYSIDGVEIYTWPASWGTFVQSGTKQLGAVNFFGNVNTVQYIEDVVFKDLTVYSCDNFSSGTATGESAVCFDETTSFEIEGVHIPVDTVNGFNWIVTSADVTGSMDPYNEASLLGTFALSDEVYTPLLLNDGTQLPAGTYFFSAVSFGSATDTDGTLEGLDFTNGCVETGNSVEVTLLPEYDDLAGTTSSIDEMIPPGLNGEASVSVSGGSGSYSYEWSNGGMTSTITGLAAGDYTVTISDDSGCVSDTVQTVTVGMITGVHDLALQAAIQLYPNPAKHFTTMAYEFEEAKDLQVKLYNNLGQLVLSDQIDNVRSGHYKMDLQQFASGLYFLNVSDGSGSVIEKLMVE